MCTTTPKTGPAVDEKSVRFAIRDLIPEDLTAKSAERKPDTTAKAGTPEDAPLISLDNLLNEHSMDDTAIKNGDPKYRSQNVIRQHHDRRTVAGKSQYVSVEGRLNGHLHVNGSRIVVTPHDRKWKHKAKENGNKSMTIASHATVNGNCEDDRRWKPHDTGDALTGERKNGSRIELGIYW